MSWFGIDERISGVALGELTLASISLATYGSYSISRPYLMVHTQNKCGQHDVRNIRQLTFGVLGLVAVFGVVTRKWVSVLFSLGVLGLVVASRSSNIFWRGSASTQTE